MIITVCASTVRIDTLGNDGSRRATERNCILHL